MLILAALVVPTLLALCICPRKMRAFMEASNSRSAVRQVIAEAKLVSVD